MKKNDHTNRCDKERLLKNASAGLMVATTCDGGGINAWFARQWWIYRPP